MVSARPLFRSTEVPARVVESFILSRYRFPDYSFVDCLLSAFRPTNETGNFWSHFLPVFIFCYSVLEVFGWESSPCGTASFFYPLWSYVLGVLLLLLASSLAHLLNAMSLLVRELCFFLDYGAIAAYTVGSSLAYRYYIHQPAEKHWETFFGRFYIPSACAVAIVCVLSCCNTRQRWRRHRYLIRTFVFLLPFLVSSSPVFYRLLTSSLAAPSCFYRHCLWLLVSAIFNVSKLPERLAPGRFDLLGHSHQWFHGFTFLSILDEFHMIKAELRVLLDLPSGARPGPTAASTYGVMLLIQAAIAAVIAGFTREASRLYGSKSL